jgi:hypothetical protein
VTNLRRYAFGVGAAAALLAALLTACAVEPSHTFAVARQQSALRPVHGVPAPDSAKRGIYVSGYDGYDDTVPFVFGFGEPNRQNLPPICSETVSSAVDIAADEKGDLIVPAEHSGVEVFAGPDMCGPELGTIGETAGKAVDAASIDAADGPIVLGISSDGTGKGSLLICSLKSGCTTNLQNPGMFEVVGVAVARNGDCWASSLPAALTYFQGCSGPGQVATGYKNPDPGGLDIDKDGNLISISTQTYEVYVYSGCRPSCKLIGGPFPLLGEGVYGHLNADSTTFAVTDYSYAQADIYKYEPVALTYMYSINNGLFESSLKGVTYNRRAVEQDR